MINIYFIVKTNTKNLSAITLQTYICFHGHEIVIITKVIITYFLVDAYWMRIMDAKHPLGR